MTTAGTSVLLGLGLLLLPASRAEAQPVPAPAPGPGERQELQGALNPTVVSERLIRQLATGAWPIGRFLDRAAGLVEIVHERQPGGDNEGESLVRHSRRLCGASLDRRAAAVLRELKQRLALARQDLASLHCVNPPPGQPAGGAVHAGNRYFLAGRQCHLQGDHDTPNLYYLFLPAPDGLRLRAVLRLQDAGTLERWSRAAHAYASTQLPRELARPGCPP